MIKGATEMPRNDAVSLEKTLYKQYSLYQTIS